jgi:hypothetical protein
LFCMSSPGHQVAASTLDAFSHMNVENRKKCKCKRMCPVKTPEGPQ